MTPMTNTIRDDRLPQLFVAQNEAMMQVVLESALQQRVTSYRILQCRYKPAKTCLVSYALQTPGNHTERIVCARIYPENESLAHYQKAREHASSNRQVLHIPAFEMVLWLFPNDRKIAALGDIADDARLQTEILPQVIAEGFGADWRIETLRTNIVHYVAEHTCTIKAQLDLRHAQTSKTQTPVLFGKTYYNDQGSTTWQAMQALQQSGIRIARPLCYQPHINTLWQLGLNGVALNELALSDCEPLLTKAAVAVAALHKTSLDARAAESQVIAKLQNTLQLMTLINHKSQSQFDALLARLQTQAPMLAARPVVTLHGDLHLKNFFVVNNEIVLIDLDNLYAGDPLADLGSFIASLHYRHLAGELPPVEQLSHTFVKAYRAHVSWPVPEADLQWHIAAALVGERVARCITRLKTSHLIDDLLTLATRISAGGWS